MDFFPKAGELVPDQMKGLGAQQPSSASFPPSSSADGGAIALPPTPSRGNPMDISHYGRSREQGTGEQQC